MLATPWAVAVLKPALAAVVFATVVVADTVLAAVVEVEVV